MRTLLCRKRSGLIAARFTNLVIISTVSGTLYPNFVILHLADRDVIDYIIFSIEYKRTFLTRAKDTGQTCTMSHSHHLFTLRFL